MLRDEIEQFTKLTGRDGWHTPIGVIGAYLDGYERGLEETRPKGKWIGAEYDGYADGQPVYDAFECSNCGEIISATDDTLTPFCPYCGADMRGNSK